MAQSSVLSSFQFDTGSGLATIAEVVRCEENMSRTRIESTPIGTASQKGVYGVFRLSLNLTLAYKKSDHQKLTDQIAAGQAAKAAKYIRATGDECTGNVLISNLAIVSEVDNYVVATCQADSDGTWTINGTSTG